jgi:ADP-ribose pyrophosphatase YjhB (NUDIX family)
MKKPKLPRQSWPRSPATKIKGSKKVYRREKKINWDNRMVSQNLYSFCPRCSAELVKRKADHRPRLVCLNCGFIYYHNPVPACAVILEQNGKILLCQRKYPPYPDGWTLPSGFLEADETPQECAKREAKEETDLEIEIKEIFGAYAAGDDPRTKVTLIVFTGEIISGEPRPGDDAKAVQFFSPAKIPANIAFQAHRQVLREFYLRRNIRIPV